MDNYLKGDENVDIWEIEDKREQNPKVIYKYHNGWDEEDTFTCIDNLYHEISSGTEQGVFCIHDINNDQKKFVQQKQGWFQYGFEEVSFEKAAESLISRKAAKDQLKKCYVVGLSALAVSPAVIGIGTTLSKTLQNLTISNSGLSSSNFDFSSPSFQHYLHKTITVFSAALMTSGMKTQGLSLSKVLPVVMVALSGSEYAKAQTFCPIAAGSFWIGNVQTRMVASDDFLYVAASSTSNPNFWIYDLKKNATNPPSVGSFYNDRSTFSLAVSRCNAYIHQGSGAVLVVDICNPCFSSTSLSSSSSSTSTSSISSSVSSSASSTSTSSVSSSSSSTSKSSISSSSTSSAISSVVSKSFSETFRSRGKQTLQTVVDITSGRESNSVGIGAALGIGIASGLFFGIISGGTAMLWILKKQQNRTSQASEGRGSKDFFLEENVRASPNAGESVYGLSSSVTKPSEEAYRRTPDVVHPVIGEEYQRTPDVVHP
ncbi:hypothetical protein LCGC14_2024560 [marine sediment metagenome]|uniref:Uncharacterized protein n=1 Tax=marine sediment metagenome TaxID=412755 RepID=A0A0F9HTL0_9ZZZZ